jgi:hypothetical protein
MVVRHGRCESVRARTPARLRLIVHPTNPTDPTSRALTDDPTGPVTYPTTQVSGHPTRCVHDRRLVGLAGYGRGFFSRNPCSTTPRAYPATAGTPHPPTAIRMAGRPRQLPPGRTRPPTAHHRRHWRRLGRHAQPHHTTSAPNSAGSSACGRSGRSPRPCWVAPTPTSRTPRARHTPCLGRFTGTAPIGVADRGTHPYPGSIPLRTCARRDPVPGRRIRAQQLMPANPT